MSIEAITPGGPLRRTWVRYKTPIVTVMLLNGYARCAVGKTGFGSWWGFDGATYFTEAAAKSAADEQVLKEIGRM
jgi:hypothetical protein